ncbi:hypothetical protein JG688_00008262 [Phytophthora aleatoria]|uniref:Ubiquitin-like protease family profile domain-containing protein n=1 Tax=Phytophthora aleatoria TaxID=2496075 RepID=A0A8J5INN5_9STRA|nr:hypothetical protein JG688_00008262 [Phytophthora aleatoria]
MVTVRRVDHENLLRKESWECDCEFAKIMKLSCRHAMVYKKSIGSPFVIPYAAIASSMKWLWNLQATCRRGVALCTCFNTEVKRLVNEPGPVAGAFDKILNAWPDKTISGFGFDITMSDIFCMRGSTWLNDDAMCASSVLLQHYKNNSTVTMPPLKQQSRKTPAKLEPLLPEKKLLEICAGVAVCPFVLVPVNFDGVHWGCLVIDGRSKMIQLHDSMNSNTKRYAFKSYYDRDWICIAGHVRGDSS